MTSTEITPAPENAKPVTKAQHGLPSAAYAIVGNQDDPSTWKLPLWKNTNGEVHTGRLTAALGHLAKMDQPARERVARAYQRAYPSRTLPDALAEAIALPAAKGALEPSFVPTMYRVVKDLSPADARSDLMGAVGDLPDNPNVTVGCMIALGLPTDVTDELELPDMDGVDVQDPADMHITLAYVPLPQGEREAALELAAAAMRAAASARPFTATITGTALFTPDADDDAGEYCAVALVDCPDLAELRADLISRLNELGLPVDDATHGFIPHVTLGTATSIDAFRQVPVPPHLSWTVDSMCVAVGGVVQHYPLIAGWGQTDDEAYGRVAMAAVAKADDAKRYTLTPLYVPGSYDSHKEWMGPSELQESQWDYVRCGDRSITLQHMPDVPAGEMVDIVTWPFPVRCELMTGDGVTKSVELPAGTVYMGVIWEEWAYKGVLEGRWNGISLEGFAYKTDEQIPA